VEGVTPRKARQLQGDFLTSIKPAGSAFESRSPEMRARDARDEEVSA